MSDKTPDALPEGWTETPLSSIIVRRKGVRPVRLFASEEPGTIPYIDIRAFESSEYDGYVFPDEAVLVCKGVPLMVWDGARCGLLGTAPCDGGLGSTLVELDVPRDIVPYTSIFLRVAYQLLNSRSRGSGIPHVDGQVFDSLRLPLPPLAEQKRIVSNVNAAMQQAKTAHAELDEGFADAAHFRQNALAEAVSEGSPVELGELLDDVRYGTSQKCMPEARGVAVLRIPNVAGGVINLTDLKYGTLSKPELSRLELRRGDLLMIRSNGSASLVGRTALVEEKGVGMAFAGYLIRIRTQSGRLAPGYLHLVMQSEHVRKQIEAPLRSTSGVNNINITELKALSFSLPPLARQWEIIQQFQAMMHQAVLLEAPLLAARAEAEGMIQTALESALRGELVPTEASLARAENRSFEDASALLVRIREEQRVRAAQHKSKQVKRRTKMKPLTAEALRTHIQKLPAGKFTFAELKSVGLGSYDDLKEIVFKLLGEEKPILRQVFDTATRQMQFQRINP